MNKKLVFELHVGKRYGISRLNCDDSGQTKDVIIDNKKLNRISSQAKKHVWREHMEEHFDHMEHVYRTRAAKEILKQKFSAVDVPFVRENASDIAEYVLKNIIECEIKDGSDDITKQIVIFTEYDLQDIVECFCNIITDEETWLTLKKAVDAKEAEEKEAKEKRGKGKSKGKNKDTDKDESVIEDSKKQIVSAIKKKLPMRSYGIECSLFGRMATSNVIESVESSICVNHSYSFGRTTEDSDYFTAVDNYLSNKEVESEKGQSGAGFLSSKDFSTHVYYEYVSIDIGHFYKNLCKGLDMSDEKNVARVKEIMIKAIRYLIYDIICAAPAGAQNSFASFPDPVGVYITVRDSGMNRTADTCCIKEINTYKDGGYNNEDEKFISAMSNFVNNDFSTMAEYIEKIYIGDDSSRITGADHKNLKETLDVLEEIINERF